MRVDLHTHTTASDGTLSPLELVERARSQNIGLLSITDHDTIHAYRQLPYPDIKGITLVPGIEFSTQWHKTEIHVVGLNIDLNSERLANGIALQQQARRERAFRIIKKFEKLGITIPSAELSNGSDLVNIGRPHFARYLVDKKRVKNEKQAFDKYLKAGKPAYCQPQWQCMTDVINCIHAAGGDAVLAHPVKYGLTRTRLNRLIAEFVQLGGDALEVISGRQDPDITAELIRTCRKNNLLASCGSDFHQPGHPWAELGNFATLPEPNLQLWQRW